MKRGTLAAVLLAACAAASAATLDKNSAARAAAWGRALAQLADCGADDELVRLASLSALADYLSVLQRTPEGERLARLTAYRDAVQHAYDASPAANLSPQACRNVVRSITRRIEDSNRRAESAAQAARPQPAPSRPKPDRSPVPLP